MSRLVRKHVGQMLSQYYSQPADAVVGSSSLPSSFASLLGEWHWRRALRTAYQNRQGHWLTPVELFQPYYSNILANFCADALQGDTPVEIVEVGGGRGTNAALILDHLRASHPHIYDCVTYTLVDASPTLHRLQQERLATCDHGAKLRFRQLDLMDVAEGQAQLLSASDTIPTVVLGMEVLDNLPHDKIRRSRYQTMEQAEVFGEDGHHERFVPLQDPLLTKVLRCCPALVQGHATWVPSVACGLMHHIGTQRPCAGLVFADFDWLPPPDLAASEDPPLSEWAEGEPIVSGMDGMDHRCYLSTFGEADERQLCDVLFPTDFANLAKFIRSTRQLPRAHGQKRLEVRVEKQAEFLHRYGAEEVAKTQSWLTGHTPLLHDFVNCSVLTATVKEMEDMKS